VRLEGSDNQEPELAIQNTTPQSKKFKKNMHHTFPRVRISKIPNKKINSCVFAEQQFEPVREKIKNNLC
jgi:hypothetical protein